MSTPTGLHNPLAALIVGHSDAIVEELVREAQAGKPAPEASGSAGNAWAAIPTERLKAAVLASLAAICRDLEAGTADQYAQHVVQVTRQRARAGVTPRDARSALGGVAGMLRALCLRLPEPGAQIQALTQVGEILEAAWAAVLANFADAMKQAIEEAHLAVLRQMTAPIIPIHTGVLVLPIIGAVDVARGERITATLLPAIARERAFGVLLDVTGVPGIDAAAADWLVRLARGAGLLGAELILVGMSPQIAATMATAGLDLRGLVAHATLQAGLEHVLARRGLVIQRRANA